MCPVPAALTRPALSRRGAFRMFGAAALGLTALGASAGCAGSDSDDAAREPDPLLVPLAAARRDATDAAAAVALAPDRAGALAVVAQERTAHADALSAEIDRAAGATTTATAAPSTSAASPAAPPTVDVVRAGLADSQRGAADLARRLDGYRAGLLGSISAAVAAQQAVLLP
ncbi:hypothetical protein [Rhodococcus kronopolitis]|uniref:Uncharacterized protein n=1 Tax=Rhodococcus kronopolitis TaxID=1460226 RepID=A0ABV9FQ25_9NOCA